MERYKEENKNHPDKTINLHDIQGTEGHSKWYHHGDIISKIHTVDSFKKKKIQGTIEEVKGEPVVSKRFMS